MLKIVNVLGITVFWVYENSTALIAHILCCWIEILLLPNLWCLIVVIYVYVIFGVVHFTAVIMVNFFFELTGFNDFFFFCNIFCSYFSKNVFRQLSTQSQAKSWRICRWQASPHGKAASPIGVEPSPRWSNGSSSSPYWIVDSGESMGVPPQLCLPGFSQTSAGILWSYDCHSGWRQRPNHAANGQRAHHLNWYTAYQCYARGSSASYSRSSFPRWCWGIQYWPSHS
jgi:hypothetical protein